MGVPWRQGSTVGQHWSPSEAGLLIGTAAIMAGTDPAKIAQLPVADGMKNEAIMHRVHRNGYDQGVRPVHRYVHRSSLRSAAARA